MNILVTGGTGYIGSHTCVQLLRAGHHVIIADNLANSKIGVVARINQLGGTAVDFRKVELCNYAEVDALFSCVQIDAIIHFAGLKAVGESVKIPLRYYENNLVSTMNLLLCMEKYDVFNFVFSSSATVYGNPASVPITEDFPTSTTNPYGATKLMNEQILTDYCHADERRSIILLRYFNPVGAHESGLIGEDPKGMPNNLFPYITQVAVGKWPRLSVFGNDYPTPDGTGVRDYLHVEDLAAGHLAALRRLSEGKGLEIFNLGTGIGYSVLDIVRAFEKANGVAIPYIIQDRRPGDVPSTYADTAKAERELGWKAVKNLEDMCRDAWRWQSLNPNGYEE